MYLKSLVIWLSDPINFILLLLILSFSFKYLHKPNLYKKLTTLTVLFAFLTSQTFFSSLLLYPLEHLQHNQIDRDELTTPPEFILVLACYYDTTSTAPTEVSKFSDCSLKRLVQAAILYKQYNVPIIVTGGHFLEDKNIAYSDVASSLLRELGILSSAIISIPRGTDSLTELESAKIIVANKHIAIVSSATHHRRIEMISDDIELNVSFVPVDFLSKNTLYPYLTFPNRHALEAFHRAIYEYLAIAKHVLLH